MARLLTFLFMKLPVISYTRIGKSTNFLNF